MWERPPGRDCLLSGFAAARAKLAYPSFTRTRPLLRIGNHFPVNFASRFSRNAFTPSRKSSLAPA